MLSALLVYRTKGAARRLSAFKHGDRGFTFLVNTQQVRVTQTNLFFLFFISYLDSSVLIVLSLLSSLNF